MPKLISKGIATSMCNNFANNNMKSASRSGPTAASKAFSADSNTQPILIPNAAMHEKIDHTSSFLFDSAPSPLLSMSPVRGGPASSAFAATKQIALHLGEEHKLSSSHECILSTFTKTTSPTIPTSTTTQKNRQSSKDPFVFDNFLPLNDCDSSASSRPSTLKKSKSFSRKRASMSNISEHEDAAPYPTSKVMRSMKKSPSRYHLASLDEAEATTQDELLPRFPRTNSTCTSLSTTSEQENLTPPRTVTPTMTWGQFADIDAEF